VNICESFAKDVRREKKDRFFMASARSLCGLLVVLTFMQLFVTQLAVAEESWDVDPDGSGAWSKFLAGDISRTQAHKAGEVTQCQSARQAEAAICGLHGDKSTACTAVRDTNDNTCVVDLGDAQGAHTPTEPEEHLSEEDMNVNAHVAKAMHTLRSGEKRHAGLLEAMENMGADSTYDESKLHPEALKFLRTSTGLPHEDPFHHLIRQHGSALTDDHIDEVMRKVSNVARAIAKATKVGEKAHALSSDEFREEHLHALDAPLEEYYAAAKALHPQEETQPMKQQVSQPDLGEGNEVGMWRRRRRRSCGWVCKNAKKLKAKAKEKGNKVVAAAKKAKEKAKEVAKKAKEKAKELKKKAKDKAKEVAKKAKAQAKKLKEKAKKAKEKAAELAKKAKAKAEKAHKVTKEKAQKVKNAATEKLKKAAELAKEKAKKLEEAAKEKAKKVKEKAIKVKDAAKAAAKKAKEAVKEKAMKVKEAAKKAAKQAAAKAKKMAAKAAAKAKKAAAKAKAAAKKAAKAAAKAAKKVGKAVVKVAKKVKDKAVHLAKKAVATLKELSSFGKKAVKWVFKKIKKSSGLFDIVYGKIKKFFNDQVKSKFKRVFNWLKGLAGKLIAFIVKILKKVKSWLAKHIMKMMGKNFSKPWARLMRCMRPGSEMMMQKCSYGEWSKEDGTCANGGGTGMNWLFTDKFDTRKGTHSWTKIVADNSECHEQSEETMDKINKEFKKTGKNIMKIKPCTGKVEFTVKNLAKGQVEIMMPDVATGKMKKHTLPSDKDLKAQIHKRSCEGTKFSSISPSTPGCLGGIPESRQRIMNGAEAKTSDKRFCDQRYSDFQGDSSGDNPTVPTEFWSQWSYKRAKTTCESIDNRCKLIDLSHQTSSPQAAYRCVAKINKLDPRFEIMNQLMFDSGNISSSKSTPIKDLTNFYAKWQRATLPFAGGVNGISAATGADDFPNPIKQLHQWAPPEQLRKGYRRSGDVCVNMPAGSPSRMRCLSQMMQWNADAANPFVCAGYNPQAVAKLLVEKLIMPLCQLPGIKVVGKYIADALSSPGMQAWMAEKVGPKFDGFLAHSVGMLIPYIGTAISFFYRHGTEQFKDWTQFDFRGLLKLSNPRSLMYTSTGFIDFSIDPKLDRMSKVYCKDGPCLKKDYKCHTKKMLGGCRLKIYDGMNLKLFDAKRLGMVLGGNDMLVPRCKAAATETDCQKVISQGANFCQWYPAPASDTGCPDSIPVRESKMTGTRYGDYAESPFSSRWPGRAIIHASVMSIKWTGFKSALCLKLPICDTKKYYNQKRTTPYDPDDRSFDCSRHGQCRWNAIKGNHCVCDPGYFGKLCKPRGAKKKVITAVKKLQKKERKAEKKVEAVKKMLQKSSGGAAKKLKKQLRTAEKRVQNDKAVVKVAEKAAAKAPSVPVSGPLKPGMVISLKGHNQRYCSSTGCNSPKVGKLERLLVVDAGGGYVGLKGGAHSCVSEGKKDTCDKAHVKAFGESWKAQGHKSKVSLRAKADRAYMKGGSAQSRGRKMSYGQNKYSFSFQCLSGCDETSARKELDIGESINTKADNSGWLLGESGVKDTGKEKKEKVASKAKDKGVALIGKSAVKGADKLMKLLKPWGDTMRGSADYKTDGQHAVSKRCQVLGDDKQPPQSKTVFHTKHANFCHDNKCTATTEQSCKDTKHPHWTQQERELGSKQNIAKAKWHQFESYYFQAKADGIKGAEDFKLHNKINLAAVIMKGLKLKAPKDAPKYKQDDDWATYTRAAKEKLVSGALKLKAQYVALEKDYDKARARNSYDYDPQSKDPMTPQHCEWVGEKCQPREYQCTQEEHKAKADQCVSKQGCVWSQTAYRKECVDATVWQCNEKKKILDCLTARQLSPIYMNWALDQFCGQFLLQQHPFYHNYCRYGIRQGQTCSQDGDCPLTPLDLDKEGMPITSKHCNRIGGTIKDTTKVKTWGPKENRCINDNHPYVRQYEKGASCKIRQRSYPGCQAQIQEDCGPATFDKFAAMM